jgi:hypothetical protein
MWDSCSVCISLLCASCRPYTNRFPGTGPRLRDAVRSIVDNSLAHINRHLTAKTASAAIASSSSPVGPTAQEQQSQPAYEQNNDYYSGNHAAANGDMSANQQRHYSVDGQATHSEQPQQYQTSGHYGYADAPNTNAAQYQPSTMPAYDASGYNAEDMKNNIEAQLNAELGHATSHQQTPRAAQSANYMGAFQSPVQQNGFQQAAAPAGMPQAHPNAGPAAWRHFADNMISVNGQADMNGQQYSMGPAHSLMALQNTVSKTDTSMAAPAAVPTAMNTGAAGSFGGMQMPVDGAQAWPMISYQGAPPEAGGS